MGRWEDDRTLVIHTSRINAGYLGFTGIQLSDEVEVVERYTLSEDQTRLNFHITTTDPQTFTEPATAEYYWLAPGRVVRAVRLRCALSFVVRSERSGVPEAVANR